MSSFPVHIQAINTEQVTLRLTQTPPVTLHDLLFLESSAGGAVLQVVSLEHEAGQWTLNGRLLYGQPSFQTEQASAIHTSRLLQLVNSNQHLIQALAHRPSWPINLNAMRGLVSLYSPSVQSLLHEATEWLPSLVNQGPVLVLDATDELQALTEPTLTHESVMTAPVQLSQWPIDTLIQFCSQEVPAELQLKAHQVLSRVAYPSPLTTAGLYEAFQEAQQQAETTEEQAIFQHLYHWFQHFYQHQWFTDHEQSLSLTTGQVTWVSASDCQRATDWHWRVQQVLLQAEASPEAIVVVFVPQLTKSLETAFRTTQHRLLVVTADESVLAYSHSNVAWMPGKGAWIQGEWAHHLRVFVPDTFSTEDVDSETVDTVTSASTTEVATESSHGFLSAPPPSGPLVSSTVSDDKGITSADELSLYSQEAFQVESELTALLSDEAPETLVDAPLDSTLVEDPLTHPAVRQSLPEPQHPEQPESVYPSEVDHPEGSLSSYQVQLDSVEELTDLPSIPAERAEGVSDSSFIDTHSEDDSINFYAAASAIDKDQGQQAADDNWLNAAEDAPVVSEDDLSFHMPEEPIASFEPDASSVTLDESPPSELPNLELDGATSAPSIRDLLMQGESVELSQTVPDEWSEPTPRASEETFDFAAVAEELPASEPVAISTDEVVDPWQPAPEPPEVHTVPVAPSEADTLEFDFETDWQQVESSTQGESLPMVAAAEAMIASMQHEQVASASEPELLADYSPEAVETQPEVSEEFNFEAAASDMWQEAPSDEQDVQSAQPVDAYYDEASVHEPPVMEVSEPAEAATYTEAVAEDSSVTATAAESDLSAFEAGQTVNHGRYGRGTVMKVLPIDGRTIVNVQFDTVGKRLLDPTLSPLEVVEA